MLTKVLISPLFKFPIPWMAQYYDNFNSLGAHWQHFIFTDQQLESRGNITVFKMDNVVYSKLVETKTGVKVNVPAPSSKFGDMRPAFGHIFEEYIEGIDYWGHTDFDMILGNLDKYVPDDILSKCDIFSDDPKAVNGIFTLYRNTSRVNKLYMKHQGWQEIFADSRYHAFDESEYSGLVNDLAKYGVIRFVDGKRHGNDKHGVGKIELKDGSLYQDGNEIMAFHFKETKRWPL